MRCYSCGEAGHHQTACPNQTHRGLMLEDVKWDKNDLFEQENDECNNVLLEDHHHGDEGAMLMLRHIFLAPLVQ